MRFYSGKSAVTSTAYTHTWSHFLQGSARGQSPARADKYSVQLWQSERHIHSSAKMLSGSLLRQGGSQTAARWLSKSVQMALTRRRIHERKIMHWDCFPMRTTAFCMSFDCNRQSTQICVRDDTSYLHFFKPCRR